MAKQVFILAGQSNARGSGGAIHDASLFEPFPACRFWHRNSPTGADDGVASTANEDLDNLGTINDYGMELSWGRGLVAHGVADPLILKVSSGGTSMNAHWRSAVDSGGTSKPWLLHLEAQWDAMLVANPGATAKALVWMQGESDTFGPEASYGDRLENMIAEIRAHVGASDLPFYITTMVPIYPGGPYLDNVTDGQVQAAAAHAHTHLINLDDVPYPNDTHWGGPGLDIIGDRLANRYVLDYVGISGAVVV